MVNSKINEKSIITTLHTLRQKARGFKFNFVRKNSRIQTKRNILQKKYPLYWLTRQSNHRYVIRKVS
jgi:hypothetical protein